MIDLKVIKDDPQRIRDEVAARNGSLDVDRLVELDTRRRELQASYDQQRAAQKQVQSAEDGKALKTALVAIEAEQKGIEAEFNKLYLELPNFHHDSTPVGKNESANVVAKQVGSKPTLTNPLAHYEIPTVKPLIDFERGAKVSGSRFWFLKGELVHLEFALIRYALDFYGQKGFLPMRPPSIVNEAAMTGTGFFPADEDVIYRVEGGTDDNDGTTKYLSGTAEVPLASYHSGEQLNLEQPIKYIGFAPAYRREAGSYGKDTKGMLRGHEFDKLELFIFAHPDQSWSLHEELQTQAEEFWNSLGIPFQVLLMCTGDIGAPNAKKYDLEAWLPGEGKYREVGSNSNDTDFQARRLGTRTSDGQLAHTLNNTACAVGRAIIAIVENYQREDGSVEMPSVLHPYLSFTEITPSS